MRKWLSVLGFCLILGACSSPQGQTKTGAAQVQLPPQSSTPSKNPVAKYIELVGFRVREKGSGKLEVRFGVVNHSEADLGDLGMIVNLRSVTAKPGDPPVCTFNVKAPALGPEEMKEITATVPTKLRVYELPDWQFLKADFEITEPK